MRAWIGYAKPGEDTFLAVYHHWQGEPSALGYTLFHLFRERYHGHLEALYHELIVEHTAGWYTLHGVDWSLPIGWKDVPLTPEQVVRWGLVPREQLGAPPDPPMCYCHGDRHEGENYLRSFEDNSQGASFLYILANGRMGPVMSVFVRRAAAGDSPEGTDFWLLLDQVVLNGPEPDWNLIEARALLP